MISPITTIHPGAQIGENTTIDPYVTIEKDVIIGDNCHIYPHAFILSGTRIGNNCSIFPGAILGCIPQDLKFKGEETTLEIGNNNTIREYVTMNRGTASKGKTVIGNNCLIMAYCHIAHDCRLKDHIIIANATQVAGEVVIDDYATISGGTLIHQFSHIGTQCMIQGGSKVGKDVPPYSLVGRDPITYCGINSVGLRRRLFTGEQIHNIQDVYRYIFMSGKNVGDAIDLVLSELPQTNERDEIINFIRTSSRGIVKGSL